MTRFFPRAFLVAALRSPQVPSRSLSFPLDKVTQGHAGTELGRVNKSVLASDRQALVMHSELHSSTLAMITFLGERPDITDPEAVGP